MSKKKRKARAQREAAETAEALRIMASPEFWREFAALGLTVFDQWPRTFNTMHRRPRNPWQAQEMAWWRL